MQKHLYERGLIMQIKKMTLSSLLIALGTLTGHIIFVPVGVARAFPVQHLINVISAVILGPAYAVWNAFAIAVLRNVLGVGSLLAFPGGMIGALLAGLIYKKYKSNFATVLAETFGTGILGGIAAYPVASLLIGQDAGVLFFVIPFIVSAASGSVIAYFALEAIEKTEFLQNWQQVGGN